jgi:hypothetical protein
MVCIAIYYFIAILLATLDSLIYIQLVPQYSNFILTQAVLFFRKNGRIFFLQL